MTKAGRHPVLWKTECFCRKHQGGPKYWQYILCMFIIVSFTCFTSSSWKNKIFGKNLMKKYYFKIDTFGTPIQNFGHRSHVNHLLTKNDINI